MNNKQKGKELVESGKYPEAVLFYSEMIDKNESLVESYFWRATANLKLKDYDSALSDLNQTIDRYDEFAEAFSLRGVVYFHLKRGQDALVDMNRSLELEPNNPYRYSSRAYIRASLGDVTGGIEDYEKTIELDPEDAIAYNNLGLLQESLGYSKMAKSHFEKSEKLLGIKRNDISTFTKTTYTTQASKIEETKAKDYVGFWNTLKKVLTSKEEFLKYLMFLKNIRSNNPKK